ncbi:MAG: hypothetical protein RIA63_04065 [Cyclobacteriaceae bacterium]
MAKKIQPRKYEAEYDKLLATHPKIIRKGAANPYTSLNGNMYTFLSKEGEVGLRLGENDREAFLKKYKTTLIKTYGTIMKEYVKVPPSLLMKTKELSKYLAMSYDYAKTLKPKATTKPKKSTAKKVTAKKKSASKKKK